MPSRDLALCHPKLIAAYTAAKADYARLYPSAPQPFLTATVRSGAEQTALFAQPFDGRDNDGDGRVDEADERVTRAKAGQSPHNYSPAFALDVAFITAATAAQRPRTDWSPKWFKLFAPLMTKHAGIEWGGSWPGFPDLPHFEVKGWRNMLKAAKAA